VRCKETELRPFADDAAVPPADEFGLTLAAIDEDGAIAEALDGLYGSTRAAFLRSAALGSAALTAGLAAPPAFAAKPAGDNHILNFDLVFEYLQSTFYLSGVRLGTVARMAQPKQVWAHTLGAHELAHVRILKSVLGPRAVGKPFFNFRGVTEDEAAFTRTAVAMEDLTVALLAGQAARFHNRALTAAVFSLLTVEARHAAWARHIAGFVPVAEAFDRPKTLEQVGAVVRRTRFLASAPRTRTRRKPRFTG
jgi:Ferritin-like domain